MSSSILLPNGGYLVPTPLTPGGLSYEVGVWSPTIHGTSGSGQSYTRQAGRFIRTGAQVYVSADVVLSGLGTIAGAVSVGGLPFPVATSSNVDVGGASCFYFNGLAANEIALWLFAASATSDLDVYGLRGVARTNPVRYQVTDLTATTRFAIFGIYQAA